jgi:DNA-directed RNA polymerase specialized sigma24 family protein
MSKVEDKRDDLIEQAAKHEDWDEVLRLLDQPLDNLERKDRAYGLLSTNWKIGTTDNLKIELEDTIPDSSLDPLETLLQIEAQTEQINPFIAIQTFDEVEQQILLGRLLDKKPYSKLSKEVKMNDKTVKSHFMKDLERLKSLLN